MVSNWVKKVESEKSMTDLPPVFFLGRPPQAQISQMLGVVRRRPTTWGSPLKKNCSFTCQRRLDVPCLLKMGIIILGSYTIVCLFSAVGRRACFFLGPRRWAAFRIGNNLPVSPPGPSSFCLVFRLENPVEVIPSNLC